MSKATGTHLYTLSDAEQFFYDHAGYSYRKDEPARNGRLRAAILYADAEATAEANGWEIRWEGHGPAWIAVLYDADDNVMASLGGVTFTSGEPWGEDYARVVCAELAVEAMSQAGACTAYGVLVRSAEPDAARVTAGDLVTPDALDAAIADAARVTREYGSQAAGEPDLLVPGSRVVSYRLPS